MTNRHLGIDERFPFPPTKDMQNSRTVKDVLTRNAMNGNIVLIMMCNKHHLPLLLNAVYSLNSGP